MRLADPDGRVPGGRLRRFWPAGMSPDAIAICTLAAVALAGLAVIATSLAVLATTSGTTLDQALLSSSGELALLALTAAVVLGVAATERHLLPAPARVTAQLAHRMVALVAAGFLLVHILMETVSANAAVLAAVLPFADAGDRLAVGLGTVASDLVIAMMVTSLNRMRYAGTAHPQLWRTVHRSVYAAWPLAIVHGIALHGVPVWAAWLYGICVALVAVAVAARRAGARARRPDLAPTERFGASLGNDEGRRRD